MDANIQQVADDLCLDHKQVNVLDGSFTIVVSEEWLFSLLRHRSVPSKGSVRTSQDTLPLDMSYGKIESPWKKLIVHVIAKPDDGSTLKVPKIHTDLLMKPGLDFLEFMQSVAKHNYERQWRQAYHKYGTLELTHNGRNLSPEIEQFEFKDALHTLYQCPIIQANGSHNFSPISDHTLTSVPHQNITPTMCVIEFQQAFYLLQPHIEHTLHDCVTFSPAMLGQSYAKPLFVVYQMIQSMQHCHQMGLPCGDVSLRDFTVNPKLWINMKGPIWNTLFKCVSKRDGHGLNTQLSKTKQIKGVEAKVADCLHSKDQLPHWKLEALPELVMEWVTGKLCNYDYIMILNHLVGRRKDNPNYHPVLPWVMDFTRPDGGYRDLTKSKYRLNKGDRQLDLTYEAALNMAVSSFSDAIDSPIHIPHHISDVLSEITYYVFNARRTSKSVLCSHVRANWVPNEYPSSIQRMQEWTPDECIPGFFSDPDIFVSIHEDLPDLEVPSWCSGPEDFIKKHRAVLESDHVSEKLHRWIDLTFGYKLSGSAAIKAKNVCLHLVDQHTKPTNHGVVQLFNVPHPKRVARSYYMAPKPPVVKSKKAQINESITVSKVLEPEKNEVYSTEPNMNPVEGATGSELVDFMLAEQGVEADAVSGIISEVQVFDMSIEDSSESKVTDISMETSINGRTCAVSTESVCTTVTTTGTSSIAEDIMTMNTKNPIKKFTFFRSRGEVVDNKPSIPRPEHQTIILPDNYDPLASLNQLESFYTFSSRALHGIPVYTEKVNKVDISQECLTNDMQAIGCLIAELFAAPKLRMQNPKASLEERYNMIQRLMLTDNQEFPRPIKRVINLLINVEKNSLELNQEPSVPRLTPSLILQTFSDIIPFPKYFSELYQCLSELHLANSSMEKVYTEGIGQRRQAMDKVQIAIKRIPHILSCITPEGKDLLLPYIVELFSEHNTALYASLLILNKVTQYYGPEASKKNLLKPLMKMYDSDFSSPNAVLLFHRSFVSQLMIRFGMKVFLRHLLVFVVNAITGIKYCPRFDRAEDDPIGVMPEMGRTRFLSEAQDTLDFFRKSGSFSGRSFIHNVIAEKSEDVERGCAESPTIEVAHVSSDDDDEVWVEERDSKKVQNAYGDSTSLDNESFSGHASRSNTVSKTSPGNATDSIIDQVEETNLPTEPSSTLSTQAPTNPFSPTETLSTQVPTKPFPPTETLSTQTPTKSSSPTETLSTQAPTKPSPPTETLSTQAPAELFSPTETVSTQVQAELSPSIKTLSTRVSTEASPSTEILSPQALTTDEEDLASETFDVTVEDSSPHPPRVHFTHSTSETDTFPHISPPVEVSVSSLLDLSPESTMVSEAVDSVMWLAHRLGPALAAKFLSVKLLMALSQCYVGRNQLTGSDEDSDSESSDDEYGVSIERKTIQGDVNAKAVLGCLTDIALLYGDQFIFQQYFPFIHETVKSVKKVNSKTESSLVAGIVLLKHLLPYLTDKQLMDNLKMIFRKILLPLIHIVSASNLSFPTGGLARAVIALKLVDVITTVALRIGREMTRELMTELLQQFFVCFEWVHRENGSFGNLSPEYDRNTSCYSTDSEEMYCEIKVDSTSNQYKVGTPTKLEHLMGEFSDDTMATSPHATVFSPRLSGDKFDHLEDGKCCDPTIMAELQEAFTPELAHTAYIPLCRLTGSIHMETKLYNHELVWKLSNAHEKELAIQAAAWIQQQDSGANQDDPSHRQTSWFVDIGASVQASKLEDDDPLHVSSGEFGKNVALVGNRIDISRFADSDSSDDEDRELLARQQLKGPLKPRIEKKDIPSSQMGKSARQLKGSWLSYWEQFTATEEHDNVYQFTQLKLQSFVGHSAGIRALCMMDNENSFVSSSKDKMVKLWSLRNQGDGSHKSQCRYTYPYHRKAVFAATFLEAPRLVATCDGVVHVWDPFTGEVVRQYDLTRGSPNLLMKLPAPSPMLIAGMADATVRFIDTRHHSVQHEFKVASGPLGLIRSLAVSPDGNTLGVGLSSGVLSMVDIRTGLLLGGWRAHEGEVLQIKSCSNNTFVTTSVDHSIAMWKEDGQRMCTFRGANEPVHCLHLSNGQIISATTANRIGVHSSIDQHAGYYSTRLRSDVFKGVISTMEVLPLNKLLLIGSDNGTITLLA